MSSKWRNSLYQKLLILGQICRMSQGLIWKSDFFDSQCMLHQEVRKLRPLVCFFSVETVTSLRSYFDVTMGKVDSNCCHDIVWTWWISLCVFCQWLFFAADYVGFFRIWAFPLLSLSGICTVACFQYSFAAVTLTNVSARVCVSLKRFNNSDVLVLWWLLVIADICFFLPFLIISSIFSAG